MSGPPGQGITHPSVFTKKGQVHVDIEEIPSGVLMKIREIMSQECQRRLLKTCGSPGLELTLLDGRLWVVAGGSTTSSGHPMFQQGFSGQRRSLQNEQKKSNCNMMKRQCGDSDVALFASV